MSLSFASYQKLFCTFIDSQHNSYLYTYKLQSTDSPVSNSLAVTSVAQNGQVETPPVMLESPSTQVFLQSTIQVVSVKEASRFFLGKAIKARLIGNDR